MYVQKVLTGEARLLNFHVAMGKSVKNCFICDIETASDNEVLVQSLQILTN